MRLSVARVGIASLTALALAAGLSACGASTKGPTTLNWYVFPEPSGSFAKAASDCTASSHGAYRININLLSTSSDQQRVSLVRRLAAGDPSIDIIAMDVDWTAEFATAKWIRPWTGANAAAVTGGVLPGPLQTAKFKGTLYGAPLNSNTQLLWYRTDLVPKPPKTWDQMIDDAIQLAKEGKPHYIEEQGAKYEGLTVWFNSLVNSAGGGIVSPDNRILIGPSAEVAARIMKRLGTSVVADPGLNVAQESQADTAFDKGGAAFEINYPFVWGSAQKTGPAVFKHMGYAPFPQAIAGTAPRVSIGGFNLAVSTYSKHPQQAFAAVRCLVNRNNQLRDAVKGGLAPVLASVYSDAAFVKANPFSTIMKTQLTNYGLRPQTPAYADVTRAIQDNLQPAADVDPPGIVSKLRSQIKAALSSKALL
ncbi:MAG: ABC transporter substrate-binding protein [Solirubrobacterales bacterium]|nr:ABC transporter substrate-binding protein [Solirubrobacterales bacterium]